MNISIGARVGAGFITMLIILVACGTAGIYGVNKVSESLLFVSGDARATSDSGKLISSNLQAEMLITERILSNDISKRDGRKLMRDHVKASKAALQTLQDAGLIDEQFIKKTDDTIRRYRGASLSILASYSELQGQQDRLRQIINNILDETTATQDKLQDLISQNLYDVTYVSRLETIEDQLDQIRLNTILTSSSLEQIFTSSDFPSQLDKIKTDREQLSAVIEQTVQAMSMPALAEPAEKIKQSYTRLDQQASQMIVDYMTFRDDRKNLSVIINQLLKTLAEVEAESASLVETEVANVDDLVATSSTLIIVAAGVGVLVALLALGVIIFTVVYPIRNVAQNLEQIGLGEGDLNVSLKEAGASELVTLARGFNGFVGKIRHTISGVSDSISDLSESTHNLRQISSAATTAIQQQTAETEQAAAAVHEMTATANTVASHAQEAANAAAAADSSAAQGNRQVNTTIDTINKQLSELDTAAKVVEQLASDSDSIASVLDVINDIAEQTNLLALNAAIEAARAGDAGRGFAVVADEVRKLASRTQTATTEIQVVVTKLHDAAGKAVKAMQNSLEAGQQSAFQAEQSGQSISAITLESNTISEMTLQIASAAEEQASVAETINQNVVTISERAQDTYSASQDIEHATQQLTQLSQRLKSLVSEFKH